MADTNYSIPEALQKLTVALKEKLAKFESDVRDMRARELAPKEGKLAKHELCPLCGGPDRNGICNCLKKNAVMGYPQSTPGSAAPSAGPQSGGTQPMGLSEKSALKKCGPGCGGGKHMDKCDLSEVKRGDDLTKHMASSSAGALAPAAPKSTTSVAQANKELGGFKSIAHSPTGPAASVAPMSSKKFNIGSAGRGNPATRAVSGTIGAPAMKGEKEMAPTPSAPEKAVEGSKMPKKGKSTDAKKQGSGGEIKGNPLRKDSAAMQRAPEGAGVPGKQPVGQGGGDAHKVAATAGYPKAKLPLAGVGAKGIPQGPPKSVDVDVSAFDKGPAKPTEKFSALTSAGRGEVKRMIADKGPTGNPNAPQQSYDANAALKSDKRAGGVGFLNALIRKFRPMAPVNTNVNPDGSPNRTPIVSQRFHGATPLRRAENDSLAYAGHAEVARLKNPKPEALKDAGNKDVKRMKAYKIMKAEDMGNCAVCKKPESKCLCKGMSMNHSRTMMKVSTKKSAKKSR